MLALLLAKISILRPEDRNLPMLDTYASRPGWLDSLLTAIARALLRSGINADTLTYFALLSGITAGLFFSYLRPGIALVWLVLSGLADAVDGRVARLGKGSTPWGGVLDLVCDRIVEAAVLLGIALPYQHLHVPACVLAMTWYVNLCVFLAVGAASERQRQKVIVYSPGLVERGEAIFFAAFAGLWPQWAAPIAYLYAALEVITAAQRFLAGRRELRH
jgi:phosphatidylglycerophosphate synthase